MPCTPSFFVFLESRTLMVDIEKKNRIFCHLKSFYIKKNRLVCIYLVDRTNTAAEIAQQALQNIHAQKQRDYTRQQRRRNHSTSDDSSDSSSNQQRKRNHSNKTTTEPERYSTPDPSKFEWYPELGYHFDKTTGFYFDAKSSYFYNPITQKYMYWDPTQSTYIPVEDTITTAVTTEAMNTNTGLSEPKDKVEKVKNAQKVARVCH